ncbi:MAG: ERF family protein [Lachnospiraceae bacterium]|nr:ERF family protein [Lachnospiraceae bacterium]
MTLYEKLLKVQQELKAPKSRNNRFGGFNYRNTEDILTALKPLLSKYKLLLVITDSLELIGDRHYVKATVRLIDTEESIVEIKVDAFAREQSEKKKFDESQLTGAASSYARKYALNGLFLIDDAVDADACEDDPDDVLDAQEARDEDEKNPFTGPYNKETGLYDPDAEEDDEEEPDSEEESGPVTRRRRKRRD